AASRPMVLSAEKRPSAPSSGRGRKNTRVPRKKQAKNAKLSPRLSVLAAPVKAARNGGQRFSPVRNPMATGTTSNERRGGRPPAAFVCRCGPVGSSTPIGPSFPHDLAANQWAAQGAGRVVKPYDV